MILSWFLFSFADLHRWSSWTTAWPAVASLTGQMPMTCLTGNTPQNIKIMMFLMNFLIMMFAHYDNHDNGHNDFHDYALWRWWSLLDDQGASEREDPVQQGEGDQGHDDDEKIIMIIIKMIDPIMMRKMVVMKVMPIPSVVMCMTLKYSGRWLRSRKSCRPAFESWRSRSRFNSISMPVEEYIVGCIL